MPSARIEPPSVRERIGGRWAISLQLAGLVLVAICVSTIVPLSGVVTSPFESSATSPLAVAAQIGAAWLVLLIAHLTLFRQRVTRPVPVWWVFGLGVVASAARVGAAAAFTARADGFENHPITITFGAVALIAIGALLAPLTAYVLATREWYTRERETLVVRAATAEAERLRAVGALRDVALTAVQGDLERARSVLDRDGAHPDDVAAALLAAAASGVRPASHALVERSANRVAQRISVREVATTELRRSPLPRLVPAVGVAVLYAPRELVGRGPRDALIALTLAVLGIVVVFPVGRRLIRRWPRRALLLTVAACAVAAAPSALLVPSAKPIVPFIGVAMITLALVLLAAAFSTAEELGEATLTAMREPIREAEVERIAADRARDMLLREIGLHLHGTVQSGLVSASYAIRQALESDDDEGLARAMARAREVLDAGAAPDASGAFDADAFEREWAGVLDIEWRLAAPDWQRAADLIRECLANAVVHGSAERAIVEVDREGGDLVVRVEDDGRGPQGGRPGVGSSVLDRGTGGRWDLNVRPGGGSVVRARIPA